MSKGFDFLDLYGSINNGAHRQPAELIGAPSLIWHQALWNPPSKDHSSSERAELITSYITAVEARISGTPESHCTTSYERHGLIVGPMDRTTVATISFIWHGIRARLRFEIHTEYLSITAIIDASIEVVPQRINGISAEIRDALNSFGRILECTSSSDKQRQSSYHKFFYNEVWEKHFFPQVLYIHDTKYDWLTSGKFADLRGLITCESYPPENARGNGEDPITIPERVQLLNVQDSFYKKLNENEYSNGRNTWHRTRPACEEWLRFRLDNAWPFLESGVPEKIEDDAYMTGRMEFTASGILGGLGLYVSALGPQPREGKGGKGYEQPVFFFLHMGTQCERQIGRIVDALLQLGTLRLCAIIALPALKSVIAKIEEIEVDISTARNKTHALIQYAKSGNPNTDNVNRMESEILSLLSKIQKDMSSLSDGTDPDAGKYLGTANIETRLVRSVYYRNMFWPIIDALRLVKIEGYQRYDEFVRRRLGGAFGFIEAVEERIKQIKAQWRTLDTLYLTTAVTILAEDIQNQQSETKLIQNKIARIQTFGETMLLIVLAPYYIIMGLSHIINCEHTQWCTDELWGTHYSISDLGGYLVLPMLALIALWRFTQERKRDRIDLEDASLNRRDHDKSGYK